MTCRDIRLERAPPDPLANIQVLRLQLPLYLLNNGLGPSATER